MTNLSFGLIEISRIHLTLLIFKDNSLKEWSFKRAATIQTYDEYDPIPVPLNIVYSIFKRCKLVGKKDKVKVWDKRVLDERLNTCLNND